MALGVSQVGQKVVHLRVQTAGVDRQPFLEGLDGGVVVNAPCLENTTRNDWACANNAKTKDNNNKISSNGNITASHEISQDMKKKQQPSITTTIKAITTYTHTHTHEPSRCTLRTR